jgi:hypothetical protein
MIRMLVSGLPQRYSPIACYLSHRTKPLRNVHEAVAPT